MAKLVYDTMRAFEFFAKNKPKLLLHEDMKGLLLERNGEVVAAAIFENWSPYSVWIHLTAIPGCHWMTKTALGYIFKYPFVEVGVRRVAARIDSTRADAIKLAEKTGFKHHATLTGLAFDGGDVFIYVLEKEDCKYVATH
jgi:RimJ/RimL family protein N-acetyltransferase